MKRWPTAVEAVLGTLIGFFVAAAIIAILLAFAVN
jgi:hypothetical protein